MPAAPTRLLLCLCLLALPAAAELYLWLDADGHTHVTNDAERVPEVARDRLVEPGDELGDVWADGLEGPPVMARPGGSSSDADRVVRLLRGAVDDLNRGESARATAALHGVLRIEPGRPEAHWYLALLARQRGRFDTAEAHLRSFLDHAGADFDNWRASAERRLARLEDERRLADEEAERGPLRLVSADAPNFRILYDEELGRVSPDFAMTVARFLGDARSRVLERIGVVPAEPTHVVLYGKGAYLKAYQHRFSFRTVGFYDGRIHVVSAAHPGGELRSLLHHEYTHAVFRERTGGDRPYWLNEGMAEITERTSRGHPPLARAERFALRECIVAPGSDGTSGWIPLRRLGPGFAGLDNGEARIAYLEASAAAAWLEANSTREQRARLISILGEGRGIDAALGAVLGMDTDDVDAAVRQDVMSEFALPTSTGATGATGATSDGAR